MKIKIQELDKAKNGVSFDYLEDLSHLEQDLNQLISISPVEVKGNAEKTADVYEVKGKLAAEMKLKCSRCLTDYDYRIEDEFDELFVPKNVEQDSDQENIHPIDRDEIDISFIVEEVVFMNIPYIPLCHEDCKGLCPTCGTNLNIETCTCEPVKVDPRLADLAKWFDQNGETE